MSLTWFYNLSTDANGEKLCTCALCPASTAPTFFYQSGNSKKAHINNAHPKEFQYYKEARAGTIKRQPPPHILALRSNETSKETTVAIDETFATREDLDAKFRDFEDEGIDKAECLLCRQVVLRNFKRYHFNKQHNHKEVQNQSAPSSTNKNSAKKTKRTMRTRSGKAGASKESSEQNGQSQDEQGTHFHFVDPNLHPDEDVFAMFDLDPANDLIDAKASMADQNALLQLFRMEDEDSTTGHGVKRPNPFMPTVVAGPSKRTRNSGNSKGAPAFSRSNNNVNLPSNVERPKRNASNRARGQNKFGNGQLATSGASEIPVNQAQSNGDVQTRASAHVQSVGATSGELNDQTQPKRTRRRRSNAQNQPPSTPRNQNQLYVAFLNDPLIPNGNLLHGPNQNSLAHQVAEKNGHNRGTLLEHLRQGLSGQHVHLGLRQTIQLDNTERPRNPIGTPISQSFQHHLQHDPASSIAAFNPTPPTQQNFQRHRPVIDPIQNQQLLPRQTLNGPTRCYASRNRVIDHIFAQKFHLDLGYSDVAALLGRSKEWVAAACLGKLRLTQEEAEKIKTIFELYDESIAWLQQPPTEKPGPASKSALMFRFEEIMNTYGAGLEALVQEEFGDGTMSNVDTTVKLTKETTADGDRVNITISGKFLPYNRF